MSGLPHTRGIQGHSGNFQFEENLRETQGRLIFSKKFREVLKFLESSEIFMLWLE